MQIDKYKLTINRFTTELEGPLDRNLRSVILTEVDIYDVSHPDNQDGTYDQVFKAKVVGATEVKQGETKVKGKSKRSQSKRWRGAVWHYNPDNEFYDQIMDKMVANSDKVIEFVQSL